MNLQRILLFKLLVLLLLAGCLTGCNGGNGDANSGGECASIEDATFLPEGSCGPGQLVLKPNADGDTDGEVLFSGRRTTITSAQSPARGDERIFITGGFFEVSEKSSGANEFALEGRLVSSQGSWCFWENAYGVADGDAEEGGELLFATSIAEVEAIGDDPVDGEVALCFESDECGPATETGGIYGSLDGVDFGDEKVIDHESMVGEAEFTTFNSYTFYVSKESKYNDPAEVFAVVKTPKDSPLEGAYYYATEMRTESNHYIFSSFSRVSPCPFWDASLYCQTAVGCFN